MFSIMPKCYYDSHKILFRCQKISALSPVMHTGDNDIKARFWIVIPLFFHWVIIQFQLLICDTRARAGLYLRKMHLIN